LVAQHQHLPRSRAGARGRDLRPKIRGLPASSARRSSPACKANDPKYLRHIATSKHYAVHSGPESKRHGFDAAVSTHDMMDTNLPQFRASGSTASRVGDVPYNRSTVNRPVPRIPVTDVLRKAWTSRAYMVSDCGAINDIAQGHLTPKLLPKPPPHP